MTDPKSHQAIAARRLLRFLDLTDLSDGCREDRVEHLIQLAASAAEPIASLCVWPQFVSVAVHRLKEKALPVCTVVNFPKGGDYVERAIDDAEEALRDGASEIDLVMPIEAYLAGDEPIARSMIAEVKDLMPDTGRLKVVIETSLFEAQDRLAAACRLAIEEGADFLQSGTGLGGQQTSAEAARTMLSAIKAAGGRCGFKAAGGLNCQQDAQRFLDLAVAEMGAGWISPERFRLGAGALHGALMTSITGGSRLKDGDGVY